MKRIIPWLVVLSVVWMFVRRESAHTDTMPWPDGKIVQIAGTVDQILADDNDGTPHQRFVVRLDDGKRLLVAHNTRLAKRIPSLHTGDRVELKGEYATNARGGVIHWTHHDPAGRHSPGWIVHQGQTYQ
jgi:hypothetical protein